MPAADEPMAAQVVLRPSGGVDPAGPITAATLHEHAPDPSVAAEVAGFFRRSGFEVGDLVGISFAIAGPRGRFEEVFGTGLAVTEDARGGAAAVRTEAGELELPLDPLPAAVAGQVRAVTFTPPPDFGPGSFG